MAGSVDIFNPWGRGDKALIRLMVAGVEYVAEAPRGSDPQEPVWRCFRISRVTVSEGVETERMMHAPELASPGANGENLPGLNYV